MANIISFKAKNFKSYKDEVEFSFRALNSEFRSENYHEVELSNGETIRLLNSAVIYGANASGKSNIIWAMFALISYIRSSRELDPSATIRYEPFLLSPSLVCEKTAGIIPKSVEHLNIPSPVEHSL